jgi:sec-independent protein translocase protein TatC
MAASDISDADQRYGTLTGEMPGPGTTPEQDDGEGAVMSLVDHLEELRRRLIKCLAAVVVGSLIGFVFWDKILDFLARPLPNVLQQLHADHGQKFVVTGLGEGFMLALKVAVAIGIVLAVPVLLYQTWAFIAPALTRRERKYALPFTLIGVVLFVAGLSLGYVVLTYPVNWLINFGSDQVVYLPDANAYLGFVAYFLLAFGVVFELPLVLTFMSLVGIVNSRILRQKRMYILFGLWFLSCFITPGADPYSPVIIAAAFTILFELSIILMRIIGK